MGEWNTMKIKVKGNTVTSWLNGTEMVHLDDTKMGEGVGAIALQIHDGGGIKSSLEEHQSYSSILKTDTL